MMDRNAPLAATKRLVTQDNALVSAAYTMSLIEKRLLVFAISRIDPTSQAWKQGRAEVTVTANEWVSTYKGSRTAAYSELREASKQLFERKVRVYGDGQNGKNIRWISAEQYSEKEGEVTVTFSGPVLFHLTGMMEQFTSYDLLGVSGFKSIYSIRIYELVTQFKNTGWRQISVDQLRTMLQLEDSYTLFANFRKRVLDTACTEITKKSDLDVTWSPVKEGRKIVAVIFKCKPKEQLSLF